MSQAFLQSDTVAFPDRQLICVPGYIKLPKPESLLNEKGKVRIPTEEDFYVTNWEGRQKTAQRNSFEISLLTNKPLYGGRGAPLRWFIAISRLLRQAGWHQLRTE